MDLPILVSPPTINSIMVRALVRVMVKVVQQ
jgi:hypothetical protein